MKMLCQTETDHRNLNPEGIRHRHRMWKVNIFVRLLIYFGFELHEYQHLERADLESILLPVSFIPYPSPFLTLIFSMLISPFLLLIEVHFFHFYSKLVDVIAHTDLCQNFYFVPSMCFLFMIQFLFPPSFI